MHKILSVLFVLIACFACGTKPTPADVEEAPTTPDTLTFERITLIDSVVLRPHMEDSPMSRFRIETLLLTSGSKELQKTVNDSLLAYHGYAGEYGTISDYPAAYRSIIDSNLDAYRADAPPAEEEIDYPTMYFMENDLSTQVVLNRNGFLTLARNYYNYSGGAHGIYGVSYLSFAREPARALGLTDIFSDADTPVLSELLMSKIDDKMRLFDPDESIPVTDNFGLTEDGVLFYYGPYEIGPYAAGDFELVLTYDTLTSLNLLRPEASTMLETL